jgi:hypothetical protein
MPNEEKIVSTQVHYVPFTKALIYVCIGVVLGLLPTIIQHLRYPTIVYDANHSVHMKNMDKNDGTTDDTYDCVKKFLMHSGATQSSEAKTDANNLKQAKSVSVGGQTVDIKAFNISRGLIYAMAYNMIFDNPNDHRGYRAYYGKKRIDPSDPSSPVYDVVVLHPLDNNYYEVSGLSNYQVVRIPAEVAGPCPDMCY